MNINFFKQLVNKLRDKEYRDLFVAEQIYSRLPLKMHILRELRGWTQKQFGEKAGMAQAWVSKLEDPNYGKLTLSTLLKVASAHDVALVVDFVPFSKLLRDTVTLSPESFKVPSFDEDSFDFGEEDVAVTTEQLATPVAALISAPIREPQEFRIQTVEVSPGRTISFVVSPGTIVYTQTGSGIIDDSLERSHPEQQVNTVDVLNLTSQKAERTIDDYQERLAA